MKQGRDAEEAASANAQALETQALAARSQAARDEEALRREAKIRIGRQAAASAESGTGTTGSAGLLLEQSAVLAELDALNLRYAGRLRSDSFQAQARAAERAAPSGWGLLAGAQLLSGYSKAGAQREI